MFTAWFCPGSRRSYSTLKPLTTTISILLLLFGLHLASSPAANAQTAIYQINCGGPAVSPFSADNYFAGGAGYAVNDTIDTSGVTNPAPASAYQTVRADLTQFTYTFPNLTANGSYKVRLHFSENYYTTAGQRPFNVSINQTQVLNAFDPFTAAGGEFKAVVKEFDTNADASGNIAILFISPNNTAPLVCAIEILTTSPQPPPTPTGLTATAGDQQITLNWNAASGATSYNLYRSTTAGGEGTTPYKTGLTGTSYTDTGLTNGTTYYYKLSALNAQGESGQSSEASATPGSAAYQINAGGPAVSPFAADNYFTGGAGYAVTDTIDTSGVTNPAPAAAYQTVRADLTQFSYIFPSLTASGSYKIRLHFSENYYTTAGQRPFNVTINSTQVLTAFDPFTAAGGEFKAVVREFNTTADASGNITILFASPDSKAPIVCAIEVLSAAPQGPAAPTGLTATAGNTQISLNWNAVSGATTYNLYRALTAGGEGTTPYKTGLTSPNYTDTGLTNGTAYYYKVSAVNAVGESGLSNEASAVPGAVSYKVNAGGPTVSPFSADANFTGGAAYSVSNSIDTSGVSNPAPAAVYQTQRADLSQFSYAFPNLTANGSYKIRLHFAEVYWTVPGQRPFDVIINGNPVLHDFDAFTAAGGANKAVIKEFNVTADAGGNLNLVFSSPNNKAPFVCALEVSPISNARSYHPIPPWAESAIPTDSFSIGGSGPSAADSVNLSSGEEMNSPGPDIAVRNPTGPTVVYERQYRSTLAQQNYFSPGLSPGWVDNYDVNIQGPNPAGTWGQLTIQYPNGASEPIGVVLNTSGNPTGVLSPPLGAPYLVTGTPSGTVGQWLSLTITFKDETSWTFTPNPNRANSYRLASMANILHHSVIINRMAGSDLIDTITDDGDPNGSPHAPLTLLQFNYLNGSLHALTDTAAAMDSDKRRVQFNFDAQAGANCLLSVSQIGLLNDPFNPMWQYGYTNIGGAPLLTSVAVPDPTGGMPMQPHSIHYDPTGMVMSLVDANMNQRVYTYNPANSVVQVNDPAGQMTQTWTQNLSGSYLDAGSVDANAKSSMVAYGNMNNPYQPTSLMNRNLQVSNATYDTFGNPLTLDVPSNNGRLTTTTVYDSMQFALGRVRSVTTGSIVTSFEYDTRGLLKTVSTPKPGTSGNSGSVQTGYTYTPLGNVSIVNRPAPSNSGQPVPYTYNYTTDGAYGPIPEALGEPLAVSDPLNHSTHYRYDHRGNVVSVIDATGNETDYHFNVADQVDCIKYPITGPPGSVNAKTVIHYLYPGGPVQYRQLFDESGGMARQVNRMAGNEDETKALTGSVVPSTSGFDAQYRLKSLTDGNMHAFQHHYDSIGNLDKLTFPNTTDTLRAQFDDDQNQKGLTNARNQQTNFTLAPDDSRLTDVMHAGNNTPNVHLDYDNYGRVTLMDDGVQTTTSMLDDLGMPTVVTTTFDGKPWGSERDFSYYPDGHRAGMWVDKLGDFTYQYDAAGRLKDVTFPWDEGHFHYNYDDAGRLTEQISSRTDTVYSYNGRGQLVVLTNFSLVTMQILSQFTIHYDAVGNRTKIDSQFGGSDFSDSLDGSVVYTYDNQDRLTHETASRPGVNLQHYVQPLLNYDFAYTPDPGNNLTTVRHNALAYNANDQITGNGFLYDADGNPANYFSRTLSFDAENRLTSMDQGGFNFIKAGYGGDGLRVWKQKPIEIGEMLPVYAVYDGDQVLFEFYDTLDGGIRLRRAFGYGAAGLAQEWQDSEFFGGDPTNAANYDTNPVPITFTYDPAGNLCSVVRPDDLGYYFYFYDAFGQLAGALTPQSVDPDIPDNALDRIPIGFGGQWGYYTDITSEAQQDSTGIQAGLVLLGQRYYDPGTARFLTRDPIGYEGGINIYAYTGNNPVNSADPSGMDGLDDASDELNFGAIFRIGLLNRRVSPTTRAFLHRIPILGRIPPLYSDQTANTAIRRFLPPLDDNDRRMMAAAVASVGVRVSPGPLGNAATIAQDEAIAKGLTDEGWTVTHGGGQGRPQEFIPDPDQIPSGVGRPRGGVLPDITAVKGSQILRVQTVDTLANGDLTPREFRNARTILQRRPNDALFLVPKKR